MCFNLLMPFSSKLACSLAFAAPFAALCCLWQRLVYIEDVTLLAAFAAAQANAVLAEDGQIAMGNDQSLLTFVWDGPVTVLGFSLSLRFSRNWGFDRLIDCSPA